MALTTKKIRVESGPFPYYYNEVYLVKTYWIDQKVNEQPQLRAYRNGEHLGYGFKLRANGIY